MFSLLKLILQGSRYREHRRDILLSPPSGDTLPGVFFVLLIFLFSLPSDAQFLGGLAQVPGKCIKTTDDYAYHKSQVVCVMAISCEARPKLNRAMISPYRFKGRACCQTISDGVCPSYETCFADISLTNKECTNLKPLGYCPTRPSGSKSQKPSSGAQ